MNNPQKHLDLEPAAPEPATRASLDNTRASLDTTPASLDATQARPDNAHAWLDGALDEAVLRCDHAGRVLEHVGPERLMPADIDALRGRAITDLATLPAPMRHAWATAFERAVDTQHPQICDYRLDRGAGPRAFEARFVPLAASSVAVAIRDVGERDLLRELASSITSRCTTSLTGLGNMRSLRERLDAWIRPGAAARSRRRRLPVALLDDRSRSLQAEQRAAGTLDRRQPAAPGRATHSPRDAARTAGTARTTPHDAAQPECAWTSPTIRRDCGSRS